MKKTYEVLAASPSPKHREGFNCATNVQKFSPNSVTNRSRKALADAALRVTANVVEPDPDISETSVSVCCWNHRLISASSRYLVKTAGSRSLRKLPHSVSTASPRFHCSGSLS